MLADSAYGSGALRAELEDADMEAVIKPAPLQTAVPGGYSVDDFDIDAETGTVTCPAGVTVNITKHRYARFGAKCRSCPVRSRCTTAKSGRVIKLHPHHQLLAAARAQARTREFQDAYHKHRPMAERSIAWLVHKNRRCPYIGTHKNRHWLTLRAAAVNLKRLTNLGTTPQRHQLGHHLTQPHPKTPQHAANTPPTPPATPKTRPATNPTPPPTTGATPTQTPQAAKTPPPHTPCSAVSLATPTKPTGRIESDA